MKVQDSGEKIVSLRTILSILMLFNFIAITIKYCTYDTVLNLSENITDHNFKRLAP